MKLRILVSSLIVTLGFCIAAPGWADGVRRVVVVETDDVSAYVQQMERGIAILERLNSPATIHVLVATFAGPGTGDVVVTVDFASMIELAESDALFAEDDEYRAWLAGLDDIRTIVSDSIYRDITP